MTAILSSAHIRLSNAVADIQHGTPEHLASAAINVQNAQWEVEQAMGAVAWPSGVLNRERTLELLTDHNAWRRGAGTSQTDPRLLGLALDAAITAISGGYAHPARRVVDEAAIDWRDNQRQTWTCRIGVVGRVTIPNGGDAPMRDAVQAAFEAVTGQQAEHCFSGWGDKWSELELACIENRAPNQTAALPAVPEGVVDDEITLSDVSGVFGEIAEQFDGGEYHVSEETRRVLIDFAHGITDHPLFSIVGRHFVQSRSAWLIEHRNRGWWRGFQGGESADDIWCRDANRAIRFYSKLDAERAIGVLGLPAASVFASEYTMLSATRVHDQPEGSDNG